MKKYIIIATFFSLISCVQEDINKDEKAIYEIAPQYQFANAEKELTALMTSCSVSNNVFRIFTQYWAETQYIKETQYDITTNRIPDGYFTTMYVSVIGNLNATKKAVLNESNPGFYVESDFQKIKNNKLAIITILQTYAFQNLVDVFGDIPYFDSLSAIDKVPKSLRYDDAKTIYLDLIQKLNFAISQIDPSKNLETIKDPFALSDNIYGGDVNKWKLFANSLKVKIGINLSDVNEILAKETIESAVKSGVILTNLNNASFVFSSASPNYNPLYRDLVASGRNDFVPCQYFINQLYSVNDPRLNAYFENKINGKYVGGIFGEQNNLNYNSSYSTFSNRIKKPDFASLLMEASEINFYLAEAAERGFIVGNNAQFYYENGIKTSMDYWGIDDTIQKTYLAQNTVNYATATGNWKQKIGFQMWLAFYNRGLESWNAYRRLDYPTLIAPPAQKSVPVRYTYSIDEQTTNGVNLAKVKEKTGDALDTKIFWDKY